MTHQEHLHVVEPSPIFVLRNRPIAGLALALALAGCWRGSAVTQPATAPHPAAAPEVASPREPARREQLTPRRLLATIETSYMAGLRRCYKAQLKRDARAGGRVVVTFTVDTRGRLSSRDAKGVATKVERCVERAMQRWEFPPARDATGAPTEATFRLALRLTTG